MKCQKCGLEMIIDHVEYRATGDNSPSTVTKMYNVPFFRCVNLGCTEQKRIIEGNGVELVGEKAGTQAIAMG